jgi:hypothetical protein
VTLGLMCFEAFDLSTKHNVCLGIFNNGHRDGSHFGYRPFILEFLDPNAALDTPVDAKNTLEHESTVHLVAKMRIEAMKLFLERLTDDKITNKSGSQFQL